MKTFLFALAVTLAMPIGAQEPMTYDRLCGATEGTGDNNDFCALWAQNNWQGMRNALSISIRTARAEENRNRYYFDHKRGADRGAFIQLKRPWMSRWWSVRQDRSGRDPDSGRQLIRIVISDTNLSGTIRVQWELDELRDVNSSSPGKLSVGYRDVQIRTYRVTGPGPGYISSGIHGSIGLRNVVECTIDQFGWVLGEVELEPDCD